MSPLRLVTYPRPVLRKQAKANPETSEAPHAAVEASRNTEPVEDITDK